MNEKALGLLGISQKGGNVAIGEEPVGNAARTGKARLIILAADAADHTVRRAKSFAALHESPLIAVEADKKALGALFGRTSVAMLTLTDIFLAQRFLELLEPKEQYQPQLEAVQKKAAVIRQRKQAKGKKG